MIALVIAGCSSSSDEALAPIKVELELTGSGYQLMRGGEPYTIKGAGMGIDDIESFAAHGGNSIRNWTTVADNQGTQDLLDSAHANGVTVSLCLSMRSERGGFDYNDVQAVAAQLDLFREEVLKYRDHPALLVWIIGNELNHSYTNAKVYDAVNDVASMIRELDPNHPTTTTLAGFREKAIDDIKTRAPNLDFISIQLYGELFGLPDRIQATNFRLPFMVTEWGTLGYWEMETTSWGAPVELTSSEKAAKILEAHREILAKLKGQLIGSYVFLWGQKQERTPTWFGVLTESGEETESVDVMHFIWNGAWPADRSPRVNSILLDGKNARQNVALMAGETYEASFDVFDHQNGPLSYRWEVKPESDADQVGGDREDAIPNIEHLIDEATAAKMQITAPGPGAYRLFAYAYDAHGHAAHANIPFLVSTASVE